MVPAWLKVTRNLYPLFCKHESKVVPSSEVTVCATFGSCQSHSIDWPTLTVMLLGVNRPTVFGSGTTFETTVGVTAAVALPLTVQPASPPPVLPFAPPPPQAASVRALPATTINTFQVFIQPPR